MRNPELKSEDIDAACNAARQLYECLDRLNQHCDQQCAVIADEIMKNLARVVPAPDEALHQQESQG